MKLLGRRKIGLGLALLAAGLSLSLPSLTQHKPPGTVKDIPKPAPKSKPKPKSRSTPAPAHKSTPSASSKVNPAAPRPPRNSPKDGAEMVWIPAGKFRMGDEEHTDNPSREVAVNGFWIYKNLVTVKKYKQFCKATNRPQPEAPDFDPTYFAEEGGKDDYPVVNVSWEDANAYCKWAGVSLPTEMEWEKAARFDPKTGLSLTYPWGKEWDGSKCANSVSPNNLSGTEKVGSHVANSFGVYDMAGNVWQWCADYYDIGDKTEHVLRGGSWSDGAESDFQCSFRFHGIDSPENREPKKGIAGFRCVLRSSP